MPPDENRRPKDFDMRRPDGAGKWIYHHRAACERATCPCHGDGPTARDVPAMVPYNLTGLLRAAREQRTAILVEGEGDADRLIELGFIATTNPYGTRFQYPQSWHHWFDTIPRWIVIPDADVPGRQAANERAAFIGVNAIVADLYPERTDRKNGPDISDWLDEHPKTQHDQRALLEKTLREIIRSAGTPP